MPRPARSAAAAIWFSLFGAAAEARAQPPSVEAILGAPYVAGLTAASRAERVAWVIHEHGRRNVWSASAPDFKPRQITRYSEDDGQELQELSLSSDGAWAAYVRGGKPNRDGAPNPLSITPAPHQEIYVIKTSGGEPRRIARGDEPVISPNTQMIAWVEEDKIHIADLTRSAAEQVRLPRGHESIVARRSAAEQVRLPRGHESIVAGMDGKREQSLDLRGHCRTPVWSPDSTRVAFRSDRGDHAFIGVYDLAKKRVSWISPSVDRDHSPVWSPDGKQLAFLRMPGDRADRAAHWTRREHSFTVWIADAATGRGREVWTSPKRTDAFALEYPAAPLMWGAGDQLLFFWEGDGWMRLYTLARASGIAVALSPAGCEVEGASLSKDRTTAFFWSNCGDPERRHVWRVPIAGGPAVQLTFGARQEWSPVALASGERIAFLQSTFARPPAPALLELTPDAKPRMLILEPAREFPSTALVEPQTVSFKAKDGLEIRGQLLLPAAADLGAGAKNTRRPAILFVHGGPARQMLLGWHYLEYYHYFYAMNQLFAARGYIVLEVNFRGGIGYGRAFRTAPGTGPRGASEFQDIVAAAEYLRERPDVDAGRVGIWGGSYGGYLTALGLARRSDLFAAGVDFAGVHNRLRTRDSEGQDALALESQRIAVASSPIADVEKWRSPVLFVHGDDDRAISFSQTVDLVQRLRGVGKVHVEALVLPDEGHGWLVHASMVNSYAAAAEFLDRFLKPAR